MSDSRPPIDADLWRRHVGFVRALARGLRRVRFAPDDGTARLVGIIEADAALPDVISATLLPRPIADVPWGRQPTRRGTFVVDRRFEFAGLAPGAYDVLVESSTIGPDGAAAGRAAVVLADGESREIRVRVERRCPASAAADRGLDQPVRLVGRDEHLVRVLAAEGVARQRTAARIRPL